jgi:hypothetical protein
MLHHDRWQLGGSLSDGLSGQIANLGNTAIQFQRLPAFRGPRVLFVGEGRFHERMPSVSAFDNLLERKGRMLAKDATCHLDRAGAAGGTAENGLEGRTVKPLGQDRHIQQDIDLAGREERQLASSIRVSRHDLRAKRVAA